MRTTMANLLNEAKKGGYCLAAPNVFNMESVQAIFQVSEQLHAPIIIDCATMPNTDEMVDSVEFYERRHPNALVTLNLDHGDKYEDIIKAITLGFNSVMIDRSSKPFEDNIREVAEIVKIAHAVGVSVEAELGHVGYNEGHVLHCANESTLTDPKEAVEFVERTGVDCLAVAVGTTHGLYKDKPHLQFDLLQVLDKEIPVPLVLHGGSNTGDDQLRHAVECGIHKINLFTDLSLAAVEKVKEFESICEKKGRKPHMFEMVDIGAKGYAEKLAHYVRLFGGENQIK